MKRNSSLWIIDIVIQEIKNCEEIMEELEMTIMEEERLEE